MFGRIIFTAFMLSGGAMLHRSLNENVVGSSYVLVIGLGFGLLLLGVIAVAIYAVKGTLKVFPDYSRQAYFWQERSAWYALACVVMLCGFTVISAWNQMSELRPQKIEEWTVTYNGKRPTSLLYFAGDRGRRETSKKVLMLEKDGQRVVYSYRPYLENNTVTIEAGSSVRVLLKMGPLGLFRVERVER